MLRGICLQTAYTFFSFLSIGKSAHPLCQIDPPRPLWYDWQDRGDSHAKDAGARPGRHDLRGAHPAFRGEPARPARREAGGHGRLLCDGAQIGGADFASVRACRLFRAQQRGHGGGGAGHGAALYHARRAVGHAPPHRLLPLAGFRHPPPDLGGLLGRQPHHAGGAPAAGGIRGHAGRLPRRGRPALRDARRLRRERKLRPGAGVHRAGGSAAHLRGNQRHLDGRDAGGG